MTTQATLHPTRLPGVYQIPVPTPFKVGPVNVYLLEGEPLTLIDTGPRTDEAFDYLKAALATRGWQLGDLQQLVISHHHVDHLGLARRVMDASEAALICHEYAVPHLEAHQPTLDQHMQFIITIYTEAGVPPAVIDTLHNSQGWYDRYRTPPVTVSRTVGEGDTLQAGGYTWRVYHTPGHAGDLICLYEPESRVLLASDHLILTISSNPLIEPAPVDGERRPRRLLEYLHHMQRVADLEPVVAYSGHGAPVEDVPGLVAKRIAFHNQRAERYLAAFEGQPHNLWEMTKKLFSEVGPSDQYLALSEVLGHIDLLEQQGRLARTPRDGVIYWQPVS